MYDTLIVGCGVAGLTTAIKLAEEGLKICIVTREEKPEVCNTYLAQGGIVFPQEQDDKLIKDICKASVYTSNMRATKLLAERAEAIFKEILLEKVKTDFSRDENGELKFTQEGAHSHPRILFKGDYTGKAIQISMLNYLSDKEHFPKIDFLTSHTAIDLITPNHNGIEVTQRYEDNRVLGAYVFDQKTEKVKKILAKCTVLATGGIGSLYLHNTNSYGIRGDGHAMAKRAGAFLGNMEFIQFHPTTFYDRYSHRRFLISEAVRGEGGILLNSDGQRFMEKYHEDLELAPRDVVARAILDEMIKTKHDCVYLDISHKDNDWIKNRYPTIYNNCLEKGIDITSQSIPVVPAAHYSCGGVKVKQNGRTNLENLYAVGEVACTGLHGANRLASTSLLEGVVWGYVAAEDIIKKIEKIADYNQELIKNWENANEDFDLALISQDWMTLKQTMWNYVGLKRSQFRLSRARAIVTDLYEETNKFYRYCRLHDDLIGLRNAVEIANSVIVASSKNKESVGCFYLE